MQPCLPGLRNIARRNMLGQLDSKDKNLLHYLHEIALVPIITIIKDSIDIHKHPAESQIVGLKCIVKHILYGVGVEVFKFLSAAV